MASNGWEQLGAALGGDSEAAYQKGRALGAQTEAALAKARADVDETKAKMEAEEALVANGVPRTQARAMSTIFRGGGGIGDLGQAMLRNQEFDFRQKAGDPSLPFDQRNIALQGVTNAPVERFGTAGEGMIQDKFSNEQPMVTPIGEAMIGQRNAAANLSQQRADHPEQFRVQYGSSGDPAMDDAIQKAVAEGRLDPSRLNSRTAPIYGRIALSNPTLNFNRMIADATLQKNPTFQQRSMTLESLPEVMSSMVQLGHKVGFSDNRTLGNMQAWLKGEFNDPDMQEYMTVRNDALMTIANVMRGVGMSDQAHRAEIEAASPTMSPAALDAWLRGQMASLEPRMSRVHRVTNLGNTPPAAATPGAAPAAPAAPAMSLDEYLKSKGH